MTPSQKILVQISFDQLLSHSKEAARQFYQRLFLLDPTMKAFLPSNPLEQSRTLFYLLRLAVSGLDHFHQLIPALRLQGRQLAQNGLSFKDYETFREALFYTLSQTLGADFTQETEEAWMQAYRLFVGVMSEATRAVAA
jgi:nitric oxide dioxygenase